MKWSSSGSLWTNVCIKLNWNDSLLMLDNFRFLFLLLRYECDGHWKVDVSLKEDIIGYLQVIAYQSDFKRTSL